MHQAALVSYHWNQERDIKEMAERTGGFGRKLEDPLVQDKGVFHLITGQDQNLYSDPGHLFSTTDGCP